MVKKIKTENLAGSADELVLRHIPEIPSASVRLYNSKENENPSGYLPPEDDDISILRLFLAFMRGSGCSDDGTKRLGHSLSCGS